MIKGFLSLFLLCVLISTFSPHTRGLLLGGYLGLLFCLLVLRSEIKGLIKANRPLFLVLILLFFTLVPAIFYSPLPISSLNAFLWNYVFNFILALSVGVLLVLDSRYLWISILLSNLFYIILFLFSSFKLCSFNLWCFLLKGMEVGEHLVGVATLSSIVLFFSIFSLGLFFYYASCRIRWLYLGLGLLDIATLIAMGRRASLLGILVAFLFIALFLRSWRRVGLGLVIALSLILGILLVTPRGRQILIRSDNLSLLLSGRYEAFREAGSLGQRLYAWPYFLRYVLKHPLKGTGLGRKVVKEVMTPFREKYLPPSMTHGHNLFLNLALQAGIPAALIFMVLYGLLLRDSLGLTLRFPEPQNYLPSAVAVFFLAYLVAASFTGFDRYTKFLPFWLGAGILLGLKAYAGSSDPE